MPGTEYSSRLALCEPHSESGQNSDVITSSHHPTADIAPSSRLSKTSRVTLLPSIIKKSTPATPSLSVKGIGAKPSEEGEHFIKMVIVALIYLNVVVLVCMYACGLYVDGIFMVLLCESIC